MISVLLVTVLLAGMEKAFVATRSTKKPGMETASPECTTRIRMKKDATWLYEGDKDPVVPVALQFPFFSKLLEEAINKQINVELFAHYTYLSMGNYFSRAVMNLPGFSKYFREAADKKMERAREFMKYQNKRGRIVVFQDIMPPCKNYWGTGLDAMMEALKLENEVYESLVNLYNLAVSDGSRDSQIQGFLDHFLDKELDRIKELISHVNTLTRVAYEGNYYLGQHQFDRITLRGDD